MTDAEGNEIGKLFVGGLSQATNNGSLRLHFSRFGEVEDGVVMMDNKTGRSRGFGYVKYRDSESVALALNAKPHIVDGKEVDAKQCNVNMKGRNRRSLKIFVGGIGLDQDADTIRTFFKQFGRVTDVNLMMDSNKQRHRGFAFVGFEDEAVVKRLISMHYVTMNNKQVEIKAMEPPNFGRKIVSNSCLPPAASLLASSSIADGFEHLSDPSGLLPAGYGGMSSLNPYATQQQAFLSSQVPALQCAQHNLLGQTRQPLSLYDHQHYIGFGSSLLHDGLLQPSHYIQPTSPSHAARSTIENMVPSAGAINLIPAQFSHGKQLYPLLIANTHINQQSSQFSNGNFISFPSAGPPMYTTFPCNVLPSYMHQPHSPTSGTGPQPLHLEKMTWTIGNTHLPVCPPQLTVSPVIPSCLQIPTASNTQHPTGASPSTLFPLSGNSNPNNQIVPTQSYPICPQTHTASILPDHSNQSTLYQMTLSNSGVPSSRASSDNTGLPPLPSSSRPISPSNESKIESNSSGMASNGITFPPVMLATPHTANVSSTLVENTRQPMWNPSNTNGILYPSMPLGWSIQPSVQTGSHQQWPHPLTVLPQSISNSSHMDSSSAQLCTSVSEQNIQLAAQPSRDLGVPESKCISTVASAKASGDNSDGLVNTVQIGSNFLNGDCPYQGSYTTNASIPFSKTKMPGSFPIPFEEKRSKSQLGGDFPMWQLGTVNSRAPNSTALPQWLFPMGTFPSSMNRWKEITQNTFGMITSNTIAAQPHSYCMPTNLVEESTNGHETQSHSVAKHCQRLTTDHHLTEHISSAEKLNGQKEVLPRDTLDAGKNDTLQHTFSPCGHLQRQFTNARSDPTPQAISHKNTESVSDGTIAADTGDSELSPSAMKTISSSNKEDMSDMVVLPIEFRQNRYSDPRLEYSAWLYSTSRRSESTESNAVSGNKAMSTNASLGVELECQGPAGAAGDFHHPVPSRKHFASYQVQH